MHISVRKHREKGIDDKTRDKAEKSSFTDIFIIFSFVRENDSAFNTDKGPECNHHRTFDLSSETA